MLTLIVHHEVTEGVVEKLQSEDISADQTLGLLAPTGFVDNCRKSFSLFKQIGSI